MEAEDPRLLGLAGAICDGEAIDWDSTLHPDGVQMKPSAYDRSAEAAIRSLQIVARVAEFHKGVLAMPLGAPSSDALPGEINGFRIVRLIAQGGMGTVYEAEQDRPRRKVALKLIRPDFVSPSTLKRFERESEVLARLQHPGIAQVYGVGTADAAGTRPFFAMELIHGETLMRHAEQHRLDVRDRVEVLARVAEAIEHAHQKGVIHRDLKPANILVDASGQPKILDFGVARATDSDFRTTMRTNVGQLLGTLSYMSPEQIEGKSDDLDARADVYALGVLLYELLAGRLPYELSGKTIPDVASIIRHQEPSRLSSIDRALRGDLETIVMKALEKDRTRRYPSAAVLAEDLRRYLRREPITARPPSRLYQLRKFARRRPELVGGLIAVFLALTGGIIATSLALVRATHQRDLASASQRLAEASQKNAERETERANRVNEFLQNLLASARPGSMGTGRDIKVADVLDRAVADLPVRYKAEPELEMEARSTLGQTYLSLGLYGEAEANLQRALELARDRLPEGNVGRLLIEDRLAWTLSADGKDFVRSEELARSALAVARRTLGPEHPRTLSLMNTLAFNLVLQWKFNEARLLLEELRGALRSAPADQSEVSLAAVMARLAVMISYQDDVPAAVEMSREALRSRPARSYSAPEDLGQRATVTVADLMRNIGRDEEAESLYRKALADASRALGPEHYDIWTIKFQLADFLQHTGRFEEALKLARDYLDYTRAHVTRASQGYPRAWLLKFVGDLAARTQRDEESWRNYDEAISILRRLPGNASIAQGWWRAAVIRQVTGFEERWGSEAIRTHVRRILLDSLQSHPTTRFGRDELHWQDLRFRISRWSTDLPGSSPSVVEGGRDILRTVAEPKPGLYSFHLEVPRAGAVPLSIESWLLVADWNLQLYRPKGSGQSDALGYIQPPFHKGAEEEAWKLCLAQEPDEQRREPALALEGWWDRGFGPRGTDYSFAIVATTTLHLPAGAYRFIVAANDGARLYVDDRRVIDFWKEMPETTTKTAVVQLSDGPHKARVEYFQSGQHSMLWVTAEPLDVRAAGGASESTRGGAIH